MILLTISLIVVTIFATLLYLFRRQYSYWRNLNIPFVQPEIPFGNLKGVGKDEHAMIRLEKYYKKYKMKTPIVGIYFFFKPVALILDINVIKNILIKDAHNFNDRGIYFNEKDDPLSATLFSIHGPKWKLLRTKLTPTFTSGKMKFMFTVLVEITERLEKKLQLDIDNNEILEIKDIMARYTTDIIGSCAFGIECNTLNSKNAEFRRMSLKIFDDPKFGFFAALFLGSIPNLARKLRVKALNSDMTNFFTNVVIETIDYRKLNNVRRNDFLDILIELKKSTEMTDDPLTLNEILAQAFVFFAAGFETSSTLLTFCLYHLASNQDIQDQAREHIEEVLRKHNGELTYEAMLEMKYLDQVLNETLRLFSPVSTLFRKAEADYKIPDTNYVIEKGILVAIPSYAIHKDPDFYPNPNEFNPENFNDINFKSRPSTTFLPFGEGPRVCIGARFGMMQARLGLIGTLRKFKFSLSPNMKNPIKISKNRFITSPEEGMWLKVNRI